VSEYEKTGILRIVLVAEVDDYQRAKNFTDAVKRGLPPVFKVEEAFYEVGVETETFE
jgi:hypothetical protein